MTLYEIFQVLHDVEDVYITNYGYFLGGVYDEKLD